MSDPQGAIAIARDRRTGHIDIETEAESVNIAENAVRSPGTGRVENSARPKRCLDVRRRSERKRRAICRWTRT